MNDKDKYLPGEVTSPEVEDARALLQHRLKDRMMGRFSVNLPEGTDVEQELINAGAYKLGTGPHHVSQVNTPRKVTEAVHVRIQNVHDYYLLHDKEHNWHKISSFTCVKMPFPKIMFSYDHWFRHEVTGEKVLRHMNVGLATCSTEGFLGKARDYKIGLSEDDFRVVTEHFAPDCWIEARVAVDGRDFPGLWFVAIDKMGQVLTDEPSQFGWFWMLTPEDTKIIEGSDALIRDELEGSLCRHGSIALAAVQFMNCRNVEVLDNPPTRQQRRQAERERRPPDVTYKTLVIHPMGQKRRVVRQSDGSAAPGVSLHIVRGHFKNYTAGAGLGRAHIHGVYWWSPQVRGSAERGRVEKDYAVDPE